MDYEDLLREKEKGKRRVKKRRSDDDMISEESIYDNESIRKVKLDHFTIIRIIIDNHDSGYLGMAVQLYVLAHLGHYHILTQKEYNQKLMAQLKSTPLFTPICII